MLTPQQAWSTVSAHLPAPFAVELPAAKALGHVLAEPVLADRDLPPAARSAMDGYAVRSADLATVPVTLAVAGEIAAGAGTDCTVTPGMCLRIFTGANLPAGADTVVKLEDTRSNRSDCVTIKRAQTVGANILHRGESARAGSELLGAGSVLGPAAIGICASVGRTRLRVFGKPTVAVITTGRELLDPGEAAAPHQERDANGPMLVAAISAGGFEVVTAERVSDDLASITQRLRAALARATAVVTSGGVSVGAYDFVPTAVADVGASTHVHGVAMKPGKPFLFARTADGTPVFALPGNPLSAATSLHEFVLPALRQMAGWFEEARRPLVRAHLRVAVRSQPGRQRYVLGTLGWSRTGPEVAVVESQSSADLAAGARADGAIIVPPNVQRLDAGALVDFRPWRVWP